MTAAWSTGCRKRYAYYRCMTRSCEMKSKSIPRAKLEGGFEDILKAMQPSAKLFELAKMMLVDAWQARLDDARSAKIEITKQVKGVEKQIDGMLDRIVETDNASVIAAYEKRIENLERQKIVLNEKMGRTVPPKGRQRECIELALKFLASPWNIYKNGGFAMQQTVLRLAFSAPIRYCRNKGYGTIESFPFQGVR